jgi:hypothetical protein
MQEDVPRVLLRSDSSESAQQPGRQKRRKDSETLYDIYVYICIIEMKLFFFFVCRGITSFFLFLPAVVGCNKIYGEKPAGSFYILSSEL